MGLLSLNYGLCRIVTNIEAKGVGFDTIVALHPSYSCSIMNKYMHFEYISSVLPRLQNNYMYL